jgi:cytochrome P450
MTQITQVVRAWGSAVREAWDRDAPPVHGYKLPYLGCGVELARKGAALFREAHTRYGDTFTAYLGGRMMTFCRDESYMRYLYGAGIEEVGFYEALEAFPGFGTVIVIGATGPEGANVGMETLRRSIGPLVTNSPKEIDAELGHAMAALPHEGELDLLETCATWIVRITTVLLAGSTLAHDERFVHLLLEYDRAVSRVARSPLPALAIRHGARVRHRLVKRISAELARRRQQDSQDSKVERPRDFLDALTTATDPRGARFSDEVVSVELLGYLFATTANTPQSAALCFLHILATPALYARVRAEQGALVKVHGSGLSSEALRNMELLTACFHETLRMYAPGMHLRIARKKVNMGPFHLPAGRLIAFSPYTLHHDTEHYTDPFVFDPDRFVAGPRLPARAPEPSHFIPFGRGPHACLGKNLARYEVLSCLAKMVRSWDIELVHSHRPEDVRWDTNGIAAPRGVRRLRYRSRNDVHRKSDGSTARAQHA